MVGITDKENNDDIFENETGRNIADNPVEQAIIEMIDRLIKEYKLPEDGLYLSVNERKVDKNGKTKLPTKTIAIHEPSYPPMVYDNQGFNVRITTIEKKEYVKQDNMLFIKVRPTRYERCKYDGDNEVSVRISKDKDTGVEEITEYIIKCPLDDISVLVWLERLTRNAIESYISSSTFGCCSKQRECIEVGECLHINRLYASGCMQRRRLPRKW